MSNIYLPSNASKARLRDAENARKNRMEIVKALSHGQVSRRELIRWGLFTSAGVLAPIGGLSPFVRSSRADGGSNSTIPTGASPSPLFGATPFSQSLLRLEVLRPAPANCVGEGDSMVVACNTSNSASNLIGSDAERRSCQEKMAVDPALGGGVGPCEGRPFDARNADYFSHQAWGEFEPKVTYDITQRGARKNTNRDGYFLNNDVDFRFHRNMPIQDENSMWTFDGTVPPKLVVGRYGEPILFRHHNGLPADVTANNGFGRHTISTHEHNGHHGSENDGFTGAFFYPGQYYDYHWPILHAGFRTINTSATDPLCGAPDDNFGITKRPGDYRETMSTHWFHDHMFSFTAQNVYKGNAAMFNIYSSLDRGNEAIKDGVNRRMPSGTGKSWGNLDYDVNLMVADKAFDPAGQLYFDIFNLDGFLGDVMTVNACYKPYFEVEPRRYRFRILNASVSRFFKIALCDYRGNAVPFVQIGNDGNLLPQAVVIDGKNVPAMDEQGIAERYDIVIDFAKVPKDPSVGYARVWLVNLCEHQDGTKPSADRSLSDALGGKSADPCVGKFLELRANQTLRGSDQSRDLYTELTTNTPPSRADYPYDNPPLPPGGLIPNPIMPAPVRTRTFEFDRGGGQDGLPWTIKVDGGQAFNADYARTSAIPQMGTSEIWVLKNGGGGWDHPIHIHFEEGQILQRNGSASNVPAWEKGRKDVYRLHPSGTVMLQIQFREFAGMYMEHCHNTQHEDNAMLVRWDINGGGVVPLAAPNPSPQGQYGTQPTTQNTTKDPAA